MKTKLEEITERLSLGHTPCGDDHEDGSGLGVCRADCGTLVRYRYARPEAADGVYAVTSWEINPR